MQLTPEIKAQIEEQKKLCIFCKIVRKEIEGQVVFEDSKTIATLDIYPAVKGHTLYMLKEHYPLPSFIPAKDFAHKFGLVPQLAAALKEGILTTGINLLVSLGGAAGQQSAHFIAHLLPREKEDHFDNFDFKKTKQVEIDKMNLLAQNFPLMMGNYFQRNPLSWYRGSGSIPPFLKSVCETSKVLYEDEKVLCVLSNTPATPGHIEIYSKEAEKLMEDLSQESSAHLFMTASLAATLVFEVLGAQGTNILLKSGISDDNPLGKLAAHILPRKQGDALQGMIWQSQQPTYDVKEITKKIKEYSWRIKYKLEEKKEKKVEQHLNISSSSQNGKPAAHLDEIKEAIERIKRDY